MSPPKISVALVVTGFDCHPDDVTEVIGVSPTDTWRTGELIRSPDIRKKTNGWRLQSPLGEMMHLEPHVRWLLDQLPTEIPKLPGTTPPSIDLSCAVIIVEQAPSITLPLDVLQKLARLGADLDIDVISA